MTADTLQIRTHEGSLPDHRIVELTGPLTTNTLFPLRDALQSKGDKVLILDFTDVTYMDSAGLGLLVHAHVSSQNAGRRLGIAGMNERVRAVLSISNLDRLFRSFGTATEAETALT